MSTVSSSVQPPRAGLRPLARFSWLLHSREGMIGFFLLVVVLGIALLGPVLAPHSLTSSIGSAGDGPSADALLGTDVLGRDVLSRILHGGVPVLGVTAVAVVFAYLVGILVGITAGLSRSYIDPILMRTVDLFQVFPSLLLLLVLVTGAGTGTAVLTAGIVMVMFPGVARLVRSATLEVSVTGYVESALARGESSFAVMRREIFPNISHTILADLGVRFSAAITLAASMNFLGLGSQPPAANWGLMIAENRLIMSSNIWAVLAPAMLLAALVVAVNLLSDAYIHANRRGRNR